MNKVAIVTGSASGIGKAIALKFASEGYKVVLSDLNEEALKETKSSDFSSFETLETKCDVSQEADIKNMVESAKEKFGRVDVMVNNAGIQHVANIEDFPVAKFELMQKIMLVAPFITMKYCFPIMKSQKFGRIINIASINALIGFAGKAGYNSAKHGLLGLTKVAALEVATSGITVNAICPGYVDTPLVRNQMQDLAKTRGIPLEKVLEEVLLSIIPQRQLVEIKDLAELAFFLSGDSAKNITGSSLVIDGGYTAQ